MTLAQILYVYYNLGNTQKRLLSSHGQKSRALTEKGIQDALTVLQELSPIAC